MNDTDTGISSICKNVAAVHIAGLILVGLVMYLWSCSHRALQSAPALRAYCSCGSCCHIYVIAETGVDPSSCD